MYCPQCRSELPDDAKYCIKCGYDFAKIKTPPEKKSYQDSLDVTGTLIQKELNIDSFEVGTLFANRYQVLSEGLKGGMGVVYKCKDTKLNKIVALKIIHPKLLESKRALARFRQEVSISQELQHRNIVKVFNLEEWEGREYFTMEWVEGKTLRQIINQRKKDSKPFDIEEAQKIITQIADALSHAHNYTIHRDIKPENILVTNEKNLKVKISDFGIAKMMNSSEFTSTSMQMGTPYYMAPEQKVDAANVDKKADIYALGVVLFELLTLENTIGLEMPSEINSNIPQQIDNVVKKALSMRPELRYDCAEGLADALQQCIVEQNRIAEARGVEKENKLEEEQKKREEDERLRQEGDLKQQEKSMEAAEELRKEGNRRQEEITREQRAHNESVLFNESTISQTYRCKITGMEFVYVRGGEFDMGDIFGDGNDNEKPVHAVRLDDYYIGKYPVTFDEYDRFCEDTGRVELDDNEWGRGRYPVINVSWEDANEFCVWLSEKTGKEYGLPTEAEWEYAARSCGKEEKWAGIGNEAELEEYAWFEKNSQNKTHLLGTKKPNGLGIYDMSGNVWEWVFDLYGADYYERSAKDNPEGPSSGEKRVLRGGSWVSSKEDVCTSVRHWDKPDDGSIFYGFRCAMIP